jgi:cobalt-zinc-cadmium efflux system outer membrane protein
MLSEYARPLLVVSMMLITTQSIAQQWTLEASVRQAMSAAPELEKSMAAIGARKAEIELSGMWPDPSIELRVDNKLGKDDHSGGYDLTDVVISQPIPLSRTKYQQSVAEANLMATQYSREYQALLVQNRVAKVFHQLQLASADLSVAQKRLQLADDLERQSRKNAQGVIVRYLSPLEKMRLKIIREEASQAASSAEGKYAESISEFSRLLGIDTDAAATVSVLEPVDKVPVIDSLLASLDTHAQVAGQQQQLIAATNQIDVARSSQVADPTVSLIRTRDTFDTGREDVYGIMLNVQIPIHDRKSAAVGKASYNASEQRIELERIRRDLQINLKRSHTHLHHLVGQAEDYRKKVLSPAAEMLELTKSGFTSGELNMLNLVDANNTYFEARLKYLNLLYQANVELADLRLYAGQLIVDIDSSGVDPADTTSNEGGR